MLTLVAVLGMLSTPQAGVPETRAISSGQVQRISIAAEAGQAVVGQVDQGETDLSLVVVGPDGRRLGEYDSRQRSMEWFGFVAPMPGTFGLEIRSLGVNVRNASFSVQFEVRPFTDDLGRHLAATALHTEAKQLFAKGDRQSLDQALERLRRVRQTWADLGETDWELAAVAFTGDALYTISEFAAAEATYREALALSQKLGDQRTQAEVLNNLAMVAWPLGEVSSALEMLSQAAHLWRSLKFPYGEASAASNRGILLWETGDYDEARRQYSAALAIFERIRDPRGQGYVLSNIGVLLEAMGEYRQALTYLNRSLPPFRGTNDWLAEGRAQTRRSRIHLTLGNAESARVAIDRALPLIRRSSDRLAEADAIGQLGRVLDASKRGVLARAEYHRALAIYEALGSRRGKADVVHDLGASHLGTDDPDNAMPFLQQARVIRRDLGLKGVEAESLLLIADVDRRRGDLPAARQHLGEAIALVETLRVGVLEKQLRTTFADSKQKFYAAYIDVLVESHLRQPSAGFDRLAFEAAERSRARGLTELLREAWSGVAASAPQSLVNREATLRKQINYWSWQLWQQAARPAGAARETIVTGTLTNLLAEHELSEAAIRRSDQRYASILRPEVVSLDSIQREAIDDDVVLVSFHLGVKRSFVWAVTRETVRLGVLPARPEIERRARSYVGLINAPPVAAAEPTATADAAARDLARVLLQPVADLFGHRRILIVADGPLHLVPFAALPQGEGKPALLQGGEVVSLSSATMLTLLRREMAERAPAPKQLAIIADPVFSLTDPRVNQTTVSAVAGSTRSGRFTRLPHSRDEANRIFELASPRESMKALDFESSRDLATSPVLGQYRLLHFATHAVQDERSPSLSGIVFSMVDATGGQRDGFLRLHDVYNLKLRAELVVLSACETATGAQRGGEGVVSLARGLFHAGAKRVMSTLWEVDDEATAHLMHLFYRQLLSPALPSPSTALRQAQIAMRAHPRWSHPYYWAGFVLQGEW